MQPTLTASPNNSHKLTVGVLFGGKNIEHEVSFNSGRTVCNHIDTERFTIVPLYQTLQGTLYSLPERFLHRGKTTDFTHRLAEEAQEIVWDELPRLVDIVFIAMHGRFAEDGTLQGMLEVLGIPYCGSKVLASARGMDKVLQKKILAHHGIATARGTVVAEEELQKIIDGRSSSYDIHTPLGTTCTTYIVKPAHEGSSLGVSVVQTTNELISAIQHAATITPGIIQPVLIEEKIEGMEFSCIIVTHPETGEPWPLSLTEIQPEAAIKFYDYDQKYMPGRGHKITPARCSDEQRDIIYTTCIATMHALGMSNFARIDGFLTADNRVIIIDPNTLGGMAPASFTFLQAAQVGMSHTALINHLINTELRMASTLTAPSTPGTNTATTPKIKVAVIMGGASAEREISLESGRNITYKLSPHKYESVPLFLAKDLHLYHLNQKLLVKNTTEEIGALITTEQRVLWNDLPNLVDFVFIALHGGVGENGCIQGMLEFLGVPYNGSGVAASALCMDKYATNQFLQHEGFDVPREILLPWSGFSPDALTPLLEQHHLTYPLIVKPHDDGCSVLVQKVSTLEELVDALNAIFSSGRTNALIENFLIGMELTVGVLGNEDPLVLPPSYTVKSSDVLSITEKFLPGAGENQTPAPLAVTEQQFVQDTIGRAYKTLNCRGYARIDCFYQRSHDEQKLIILEVNTLPGLTPATCIFHQAAEIGIKPMEFIDKIVELGFKAHTATCHKKPLPAQSRKFSFKT